TRGVTAAKQIEAVTDTTTTGIKVANVAVGATADIMGSEIKKTTATEEIVANTSVAASEAGKGAAKLPFPWNIVAIGGAIAAAIAAFAMIPKFATGGIYTGGTVSGDKGLARLNKGEMILNGGQQSRLFEAINSGNMGGKVSTTLVSGTAVIRGDDAFLQLSNYMKKSGRRLPR
ncbi:MAG: phage tail tape measure protein, partial [Bacteroidaceae bacterium]